MGFIFQKCVLLPGVETIFELKPFQSTCNGGRYFIPKHMFMEREGGDGRVSMDKFTVLRKDKFTVIDIGEKEKYGYRDVPHLTKSIFSETV